MLMGSTIGIIVSLAMTAATAAVFVHNGSKAASTASIFFIYLFGVIFAFAYTSMQPIYPAEVMSNEMRAKGMGTFKLRAGAAGFFNIFVSPIALTNESTYQYCYSCTRDAQFKATNSLISYRPAIGSMFSSSSGTVLSSDLFICIL